MPSTLTYTPANLLEQLTSTQRQCVAALLGFDDAAAECHGFRINLRAMPPIAGVFTLGSVAVAYCEARAAALRRAAD
jgi:hypothetical protein